MFWMLARVAFWVTLGAVVLLTLAASEPTVSLLNDKVAHLLGFFGLAAFGAASWGLRSVVPLAIGLTILGGAIELLQATPLIARDAEFMDFVADVAGIALALVPATFVSRAR
jgi:hypothetical protein